jgi:ParB-like chromosome segregation protein Spo0J
MTEEAMAPPVKLYDIDSLTVDPRNARTHDDAQVLALEASLLRFGWTVPMLIKDDEANLIRAGHGRRLAAMSIWDQALDIKLPGGWVLPRRKVPGIDVSGWTEEESRAYALADNQLALQAGWDHDLLKSELAAVEAAGFDLGDLGFDADALAALEAAAIDEAEGRVRNEPGRMAAEFLIPPFSVLSAREGWWQERKRQWIALGIKSEIGRGGNLIGRSLHELVATATGAGKAEGTHYSDAKRFIDERRERGMSDQEILAEAQGHKVHEAIPGGAGKNAVYRDGGKAMRRGAGRCFGEDILDNSAAVKPARGTSRSTGAEPVEGQPGEPSRKRGLGGVTMDALSSHPRYYEQKTAAEARLGRVLSNEEFERDHWVLPDSELSSGTSIFDPVLCEIAYRWFCPPAGLVLDPFAGGSVRGVVAAALGRRYQGIDLRAEQVEANRAQWPEIKPRLEHIEIVPGPDPEWLVGDALYELADRNDEPEADFLFSCPPYGDLEVYSDEPGDLSTLDAEDFDRVYAEIVALAVARLKPDRFACFVVGDYREKGPGFYRRFIAKTEAAFEAAGARLYNECILLTSAGSLAIRAGKQFRATRKVGKTHQNVLIFCKGDPRRATEACGPVDVAGAIERVIADLDIEDELEAELSGEPLPIAAE